MRNLFILVSLLLCVGCASPYIGSPVSYTDNGVCMCTTLPQSCTISYPHMEIHYTISKGADPNKYEFSGSANLVKNNKMPWAKSCSGHMKMLLVDDVVVDSVSFGLFIRGDKPTKFHHTFKTKHNFDAVIVGYHVKITDR